MVTLSVSLPITIRCYFLRTLAVVVTVHTNGAGMRTTRTVLLPVLPVVPLYEAYVVYLLISDSLRLCAPPQPLNARIGEWHRSG